MIESHEEKSCRLFDQAIYLYLISCRVESSFRVKLSSRVVESSFSTQFDTFSKKFQLDSTLFKSSTQLELKYSTRRNQSSIDIQTVIEQNRKTCQDINLDNCQVLDKVL